jgi:Na+/proline symporter
MANLSAALNSLSSATVVDFYARLRPLATEAAKFRLSRISAMAWALVLFALAIAARGGGRVLEVGLSITSVAYGGLLGVFLLGVLTKRASESGAIVGMLCGLAVNLYLWRYAVVAFTWYVPLGSAATFAAGYAASLVWPARERMIG